MYSYRAVPPIPSSFVSHQLTLFPQGQATTLISLRRPLLDHGPKSYYSSIIISPLSALVPAPQHNTSTLNKHHLLELVHHPMTSLVSTQSTDLLTSYRNYPTRSTPAQQDILARGKAYLSDDRALQALGNQGQSLSSPSRPRSSHVTSLFFPFYLPLVVLHVL